MCRNEANIYEKSVPEFNKKRSLKTEPQKSKNTQKMTPKWIQKNDRILGEIPLGAPLVVKTVFVVKKWAPSAAKVLPRLEKRSKNDTKEPPESENELQKSTLSGAKRKRAPKVDPFRSQAKMSSESGPFSDLGPADCKKRLQIARSVLDWFEFVGFALDWLH